MKPRVLLVGTAYAIREHRKKLEFLAQNFLITCVTAEQCGGFGWVEFANEPPAVKEYQLIGLPIGGASVPGTRCWYRGLWKVFRDGRYDIILVENEPWGVLRWQSWILKILFQRRAVFGEFTWENIVRGGWKGTVLSAIYRAATLTGSFAVGGNQEAAALMLKYGSNPKKTACIPQFGVDAAIFSTLSATEKKEGRRRAGLPEDAFLIAYCGRLVSEKGIRDLIEAFRLLPPAPPELGLLIMGTGQLEEEIRAETRDDARIRLCPPSAYPKIAEFLQLIDVIVLPSHTVCGPNIWWKEQFGHVLIEAMACGVVTIGSDSGAIPEVLDDPCLIFPQGNVAALSLLIRSFAVNPERARMVGARQRMRVISHFGHEQVAQRWCVFLKECLAVAS
jgi:glycosyltransferase involved in cell wall biosynthesis